MKSSSRIVWISIFLLSLLFHCIGLFWFFFSRYDVLVTKNTDQYMRILSSGNPTLKNSVSGNPASGNPASGNPEAGNPASRPARILFQQEAPQDTQTPPSVSTPTKKDSFSPIPTTSKTISHDNKHTTKVFSQEKTNDTPTKKTNTVPSITKPSSASRTVSPGTSQTFLTSPSHSSSLSFSTIAQGFLKSKYTTPGESIPQSLDPTMIAKQRYMTKVFSHFLQSFNTLRKTIHCNNTFSARAVLLLAIAKDGSLKQVKVIHHTKHIDIAMIQDLLTTAARRAGLYPPLPRSFHTDVLTLRLPLSIHTHQGLHTYDILYKGQ